MDVSNLTSGLIGSAIGASAAFLGSLYIANRAELARRHGVITALLAELVQNTIRVVQSVAGRRTFGPFAGDVWDKGKFDIAGIVSRPVLAELMNAYGLKDVAERAAESLDSDFETSKGIMVLWYETNRSAYNLLLREKRFRRTTVGWNEMEPFDVIIGSAPNYAR